MTGSVRPPLVATEPPSRRARARRRRLRRVAALLVALAATAALVLTADPLGTRQDPGLTPTHPSSTRG